MSTVPQPPTPARISVAEAVRRIAAGAVLLDVREHDEWAAGHAPAAVHLPLSTLRDAPTPPEQLRGRAVLVICRSGNRSREAAALLAAGCPGDGQPAIGHGESAEVVDVVGGLRAWEAAGYPVRTEDGTRGTVA